MTGLQLFVWLFAGILLAGGLLVMRLGLHEYGVDRAIVRRFHAQLGPALRPKKAGDILVALLARLGRSVTGSGPLKGLQDRLQRAGHIHPTAAFVFVGLQLVATLGTFTLAVLAAYFRHAGVGAPDAAIAFVLGFAVHRGCNVALGLRIEARLREIRRELPYVLDLVLMVLDSGVSIDQALQHVAGQIDRAAPVTATLMRRYLAEIEDGVPYDQALDRLAQRLAISEGRDFAGLLKQNLFQGGELGPPLRRLAADIGDARLAFAREQMGRKSVLLTLVMLAFFMPVLMIALAGPAVSDIIGTLGNAAHDLDHSRKP